MKELLRKEMFLTASPLTYLFLLFTTMAWIPGYPILMSGFFICLGIFYSFQFSREYNDTLYSALLPVSKGDVVRAKYAFTAAVQAAALLLSALFTFLFAILLGNNPTYSQNAMMNANLAYLGYELVIFGLFNLIFLPGFFKTGYYVGKPFLFFSIGAIVVVSVGETLHHIPGMEALNLQTGEGLPIQACVFALGLVFYVGSFALSLRRSVKRFEQIDL